MERQEKSELKRTVLAQEQADNKVVLNTVRLAYQRAAIRGWRIKV